MGLDQSKTESIIAALKLSAAQLDMPHPEVIIALSDRHALRVP